MPTERANRCTGRAASPSTRYSNHLNKRVQCFGFVALLADACHRVVHSSLWRRSPTFCPRWTTSWVLPPTPPRRLIVLSLRSLPQPFAFVLLIVGCCSAAMCGRGPGTWGKGFLNTVLPDSTHVFQYPDIVCVGKPSLPLFFCHHHQRLVDLSPELSIQNTNTRPRDTIP